MTSLVIAGRFNGPPSSGNGGYVAGALAEASGLAGIVTVQLRRPPPLDEELALVPGRALSGPGSFELRAGNEVVAIATPADPVPWSAVRPVPVEVARGLEASYAGFRSHPFPTCFACGPDRAPGDGLRIFPGRVDESTVAAAWSPAAVDADAGGVRVPVTWAALDCVSAWSSDLEHRPLVLGQMTASVVSAPVPGAAYAAVGAQVRTEGRKTWTASALYDADGQAVARAEHLWIAVDPERLRQLQR